MPLALGRCFPHLILVTHPCSVCSVSLWLDCMATAEQGGGPSPQPTPPKGIGDVAMMHRGGEGANPAASWFMEIQWQLARAGERSGCLRLGEGQS